MQVTPDHPVNTESNRNPRLLAVDLAYFPHFPLKWQVIYKVNLKFQTVFCYAQTFWSALQQNIAQSWERICVLESADLHRFYFRYEFKLWSISASEHLKGWPKQKYLYAVRQCAGTPHSAGRGRQPRFPRPKGAKAPGVKNETKICVDVRIFCPKLSEIYF